MIFEGTCFQSAVKIFFECLTRNSNPEQYLIGTDQKPKKKWDNSTLIKGRSGNALSNAITAMSSQTGSTLRDQALDQRHSIEIRTVILQFWLIQFLHGWSGQKLSVRCDSVTIVLRTKVNWDFCSKISSRLFFYLTFTPLSKIGHHFKKQSFSKIDIIK